MAKLVISKDSGSDVFSPVALALNEVVKLPVTIRAANRHGVRVEKGKVLDESYTGPILEDVLRTGRPMRTIPDRGAYKGVHVAVAPIVVDGETVAALGVVDLVGTIDIPDVFGAYTEVVRQVSETR